MCAARGDERDAARPRFAASDREALTAADFRTLTQREQLLEIEELMRRFGRVRAIEQLRALRKLSRLAARINALGSRRVAAIEAATKCRELASAYQCLVFVAFPRNRRSVGEKLSCVLFSVSLPSIRHVI